MKQKIIKLLTTDFNNWGSLIIRVPLGLSFIAHGWGKFKSEESLQGFAQWLASLGVEPSNVMAVLAGLTEVVGGALIIIGLLVRFAAVSHVILITTAIYLAHWSQPMFGQGSFELQLLMIACSVLLLVQGGGKYSLDNLLSQQLEK